MKEILSVTVCALLLSVVNPISAAEKDVDLKVGDSAPKFEVKDDTDKVWKSDDHIGKGIVVVYFYPADLTGGCTRQACSFRDDSKKLAKHKITVVGVSGDSVRNHQIFKKEHDLNFTLLADEDGSVAKKFGVPIGKGGTITRLIEGKEEKLTRGVTARRWTFVIDADGKIAYKNTKVNAAKDSQNILEIVKKLKG